MAATRPPTASELTSQPITSIQPGGGLCLSLELAWGRLRRFWLRRFRIDYVRRMVEKRQGHCENCPHDIIDPRDLKPFRNVCGYSFRDADDAFRWRGRIPLARAGLAEVVLFSTLLLAAAVLFGFLTILHWAFWFPLALTLTFWLFVVSFFRDPPRAVPTDADALISPADGTVTHVDEVEEEDFPGGRAFRVSIFLSVFNVHVNRVPCSGRVAGIRYFGGCFLDARHKECAVRNEQLWVDLEETGASRLIRVKQIAGAIARRIVCWLKPGEEVRAGDRYGMIKFGSRTEVLLPVDNVREVQVKVGDKVKGGRTILLRVRGAAEDDSKSVERAPHQ
jgi:phosphatidylserine decarboxylase